MHADFPHTAYGRSLLDEMRHYARRHPEVRAHPHVSGQAAAIRWHHPELAAIERPDVTAWQAFLDRTLPRKGRDADPYAAFAARW